MDYGKYLKNEREKRGISQKKLADMAGVAKRSVAYWENGKKRMTIESAEKVFKALDVEIIIGGKKL